MHGFWAVFWLAVILKIPIVGLLTIVWWAVRQPPVAEADRQDGDGGSRHGPHPRARPAAAPASRPARRSSRRPPPDRVRVTRRGPRVPDSPDR